jgi:ubiquinone/menaquinone biosynthesis C-methylase UbiE
MELEEYRRMAEFEEAHWWYVATRALLSETLSPYLASGDRILDAGGGTGATGAWLSERGRLVVADMEPMGLRLNRERHHAEGFVVADLGSLPFARDSFGAVLCVTVLYHRLIESPSAVVGELARVTRPGGVVCLLEPGVRSLRRAHDRVTHTARRFSRRDLCGLLTANGLHVERATGAYSFLVPAAAAKAVIERGRTESDLDEHRDGLGGLLAKVAAAERAVLRRVSLPAGLSVLAVGRVADGPLLRAK